MRKPAERNFYTADRQYTMENLDWDLLGTVRDVDKESYISFLETTVGDLAGKKLAPRSYETEKGGFTIKDGNLVWPDSVEQSFEDLVENGLVCTNVDEEHGGSGLPSVVNAMIGEMIWQADPGFASIALLTSGVAEVLEAFASPELQAKYLPRMVEGKCLGSMDLTEAGAGSDLGEVRTRAVQDGENYRITGTKQFITSGGGHKYDHIHLVLARDDDGYTETLGTTKGLSMYVVPTSLDGGNNNVKVTGLEHKLGIHSSPTCSILFDEPGAVGYLVGVRGNGLKQMFTIMDGARLGVTGEALANIEAARYDADEYAQMREQFGKPIKDHALVKDMFKEMTIGAELIRAAVYSAAFAEDMARGLDGKGDKAQAKKWKNKANVLIPLLKFYAAEKAVELTRTGLQIHGGVGYTTECNAEKHLRDALITPIYEGTSEIQASLFLKDTLTAVFKKKSRADPRPLLDEILDAEKIPGMEKSQKKLKQAAKEFGKSLRAIKWYMTKNTLLRKKKKAMDTVPLVAKHLANHMTEVYGAHLLLQQTQKGSDEMREHKRAVAKVCIEKLSRQSKVYHQTVKDLRVDALDDLDKIV